MSLMVLFYSLSLLFSKHTDQRAFRLRRNFCRIANTILNIHFEAKGSVTEQPALYVCNHRSFSDPMVLTLFLEAWVVAKAEIADMPIINKGAEITGIIYVKRDSVDSRKATRDAMIKNLQAGRNILVYPEGTTNDGKYILPYKKGTFKEAATHGFAVVPVCMEYAHIKDLWKDRGLFAQFFRQYSKWKTKVKLEFGPILRDTEGETMRLQAMEWTNQTIQSMHQNWGSNFDNDALPPSLLQT